MVVSVGTRGGNKYRVDASKLASDPKENIRGFVKARASLDENAESVFWFFGQVYGMKEDELPLHLFNFEGYNIGKIVELEDKWQLISRETGIYRDPKTNDILSETAAWKNPYTKEENSLVHVWNDPVNHEFGYKRPVPNSIVDDDVVFQIKANMEYPSELPASQFPSVGRHDKYQSLEIYNFHSKIDDLGNSQPSCDVQLGWTRIGQWLPWMQMGMQSGHLMYNCYGKKLNNGIHSLDRDIRDYVLEMHPEFTYAPSEFTLPNETSWGYYKKILEGMNI